ncbi:MAG: hypothetical protein KGQ86_02860 [Bacteroidetes bacterium]|nr:hypothetical protein [Bacteroidota bacterium]
MEELLALITLFKTMPGNAKARLLRDGQDKLKVMYDFMDNIYNRKLLTDEDASAYYFNSPPNNSKYYSLKKRLKDKLLAWILNAENPYLKHQEYEYASITLHRMGAQVAIFNTLGIYAAANKINLSILKISEKFKLSEFGEKAARNIRDYYAHRELDPGKYKYYNTLSKQLNETHHLECIAEELYSSFMIAFYANKKGRFLLGYIVSNYVGQIEKLLIKSNSAKIRQYISKINIMALLAEKDFIAALEKVTANLVILENNSFQQKVLKNELLHQKMVCYLNLKQFDEGKKVAEGFVFMHTTSNESNLKNEELRFLLSLHGQHYNEAASIWLETSTKGLLKNINQIDREKWETYKIYLYFLHVIGEISQDYSGNIFKGYRQAKFFNTVPLFNKDKAGMNVSILAIEYILYLTQGKFDKITDKYEALVKYAYRYLRNNESLRSYNFIRLLLLIPNCAYNWKTIAERSELMLKNLKAHPNIESSINLGPEIIPYEVLWKLIYEHAPNRKAKF